MSVGLQAPENLLPIPGIRLAAIHSGIKPDPKSMDLVLIEINQAANCAAVFTQNKFCAAPVVVAKEHLDHKQTTRLLLINSGNANAGTGEDGYRHAKQSCRSVAEHYALETSQVLPFSTGVIAARLPVEKMVASIPALLAQLDENAWLDAATGIMTTDTLPKAVSHKVTIDGRTISITGIAKGSGMIRPDMATMLAFVATDAVVEQAILQEYLSRAVEESFNAITIDGDTSTNDACTLVASGKSGVNVSADNEIFQQAIDVIFVQLAQSIIRDAEGATKFVEIRVTGAETRVNAKEVAYTVAHSPLVKTALFASDPNWGRILAAVGRARIENLNVDMVSLYLGEICLLRNGLPDLDYREELGQIEMDKQEITITIDLGLGKSGATVWTSDLSYDYVRINAEYRS
ncbi:MAG: bifunctional glutamate N-acetyltransferase/amino-acid acetyltransferase ArgJ [Gammaproteobacteria bacterium]|nr:bifunctional glutamate N-acetyltransferase/amino-acid acetyltransferase ArgJ [Gammaproteobacteria bacterium]